MPEYAPLGKRAVALVIDWFLLNMAYLLIEVIGTLGGADPVAGAMDALVALLLPAGYEILMIGSKRQATLGKMALGIRVATLDDRPLTMGQSTLRYFAKLLSGILLGLGYAMAFFTDNRQALHDRLAGTLVLEGPALPFTQSEMLEPPTEP